jgi:hypothetical protein
MKNLQKYLIPFATFAIGALFTLSLTGTDLAGRSDGDTPLTEITTTQRSNNNQVSLSANTDNQELLINDAKDGGEKSCFDFDSWYKCLNVCSNRFDICFDFQQGTAEDCFNIWENCTDKCDTDHNYGSPRCKKVQTVKPQKLNL